MTGRQDAFQQAMNQGHSAAWDQMWSRAASFYRQALEEYPDHPQALTSLGLALIELQDYDEALSCYQRAAKAIPDDPLPLEKIAQLSERVGNLDQASKVALRAAELYLKNREVDRALASWERVTSLDPENLQAHSRLALVYERMGEKQKAVTAYLAVASILQSSGDLEKAMGSVNRALKIMPNNEQVIQALNLLKDFKSLQKPVRPRGATAPLRMSQVRQLQAPEVAAQPESDPIAQARQKALTVLADMLFDSLGDEQSEKAERLNLRAIVTGTSGLLRKPVDRTRMMLHLSQVVDFQTRGEFVRAADELQRAIDVGLDHPAAYFDLGFLHAEGGRLESAIRQLQYAVKHADFALGGRLLLGDILFKKSQMKEAALEYLEALKLADAQMVYEDQADDLLQLYEPLIESFRQQSDPEAQKRLCDTIREMLRRADWRAQLSRAREQLPSRDEKSPAIPLAEILTEARSSQVIDSISTIYEMIKNNEQRSAMEEAFFALQHAPTYLPLHSLMGEMLVQQDDLQNAVAKYRVVARTYGIRGESQQAISFYRKVVDLAPADLNARKELIDQLVVFGQIEEAIDEYMQLAEVYYSLADLGMARKTYTETLRKAQQSNLNRPLRVKILARMADIDMQSLDWRQALRIFDQIRTLQPNDEEAWHNLVELNYRLGQEQQALAELDHYIAHLSSNNQDDKALEFLENLTTEYPDRIPVRRRLADLFKQLGRNEDAVNQLDAIGDLLLNQGDRPGALQTVEMILALDPPNKADYEKLLEQLRGE